MHCQGCGRELGQIEALYWNVCFDCTKARAATVARHGRCACGNKYKSRRRNVETLGRRWVACDRCLGARNAA